MEEREIERGGKNEEMRRKWRLKEKLKSEEENGRESKK